MSVSVIQRGNVTIKVYRPTLTEEEQKHQERKIKTALQQYGKAMQKH